MAIFWGFGGKSKNYDGLWVPYFCSVCDGFSAFSVTENYRYGQVYGIRIAKYKSKYFLVCQKCERAILLDDKNQFITAQNIARRIASETTQDIDFMKYVSEIARFVLKNSEMADAIEKMQSKEISATTEPSEEIPIPSEDNQTKECPECAETIKFAAKKCRFCNYVYE